MTAPGNHLPHSAREEILARIRAALPGEVNSVAASYAAIPRNYQHTGNLDESARVALFIDRLLEYDAEVIELAPADSIAAAIASILHAAGEHRVLVAAGFPHAWIPPQVSVQMDDDLSIERIDTAQAVITTCEAAIAATGTILLMHSPANSPANRPAQGRRVATLLPDHHLCVVKRNQICETVPEGFRALNHADKSPVTTISGPSATSDIEMTRIRGVHGPRRLTVLIVD